MSILGGIGRALMNGMPGSDFRKTNDANAEQEQLQTQQIQRNQQQQDEDFAQHILEMGARPVVNGAVKRDLNLPDGRSIPSGLLDKADSSRLINHKTADGRTVQFELPSAEEQIGTHAKRLMQQFQDAGPQREAVNQEAAAQTGRTAQASALGTARGKTAGEQEELNTNGVDVSPEEAGTFGLPAATKKVTRSEAVGLSKTITPATIRNSGLVDRAKIQAKAKTDAATALAEQKRQHDEDLNKITTDWNAARERMFGKAEAGKNARTTQTESGKDTRAALAEKGKSSRFQTAQGAHLKLTNDLFKEQQAQLQAQALVDEDTQPGTLYGTNTTASVQDGEEFTDPWTGKKMSMNGFQRRRLKSAIETSAQHAQALKDQADGIASEYLGNGQGNSQEQTVAPETQAPKGAKYKVGQTVFYQGKPHKVTGYDKSGKVIIDPEAQ